MISFSQAIRDQIQHNESVLESFSKEIEAIPSPSETTPGLPESLNEQEVASSILGITATMMSDTIISDIQIMLKKGQEYSLQGYIFALSRIISHDIAWKCITRAYADQKQSIPADTFTLFNKTRVEEKPINRMTVK